MNGVNMRHPFANRVPVLSGQEHRVWHDAHNFAVLSVGQVRGGLGTRQQPLLARTPRLAILHMSARGRREQAYAQVGVVLSGQEMDRTIVRDRHRGHLRLGLLIHSWQVRTVNACTSANRGFHSIQSYQSRPRTRPARA